VTRRPRILNAEPDRYSPRARAVLEEVGEVTEEALDREGLLRALPGYDALIVRLAHRVDAELLEAAPKLRVVATATTGLDHVDLKAARARGVEVLSLRGENEFLRTVVATSEHTFALLLSLLRRIPAAAAAVQRGEWDRDAFRGRELDGKRLGIVGLGRIGERVARYAQAFGMEVRAYDRYRETWPPDIIRMPTLETLLETSDILTVHVPSNEDTRGLISRRQLSRLPAGAVVVNTARGAVVDGSAVADFIKSGRIAGAAVDVVVGETGPGGLAADPLVIMAKESDRILITPHIGGATAESMEKTEIFMAGKLADFLRRALAEGSPGERGGGRDERGSE
jgi:D-3-phosphoglycerate dehydrogenase